MINLQRLHKFFWVAKSGGYRSAARQFPYGITEPAILQQVQELEGDLSVKLLERVGNRVVLTAAGKHLYEFVGPLFERLPGVIAALKASDFMGEVHIHASTPLLQDLLPPWIRPIRDRLPAARIHLHELTGIPDLSLVREGGTDLLVSWLPKPAPDGIETVHVATLHGFLVVPSGHPLAKRTTLSLQAIKGEPFIGYTPGTLAYEVQERALAERGVRLTRTLTAGTAQTILAIVAAGLGVSALASLNEKGLRRQGVRVIRFKESAFELPVMAAFRKGGPPHPLLKEILAGAPRP
jgi:DNA-binding transcriptional LysR family regulator